MAAKTKLSRGILDMKFMKRTKDKVIKEEDDAEGRAMYSGEITDKMLQDSSRYIIEPSFIPCENLLEGRFSFRGMNPEIERILELEEQARQAKMDKDVHKDVTDKDMSTYYTNLAQTVAKKFNGRARGGTRRKMDLPEPVNKGAGSMQHQNKKPRFMKPDE